MASDDSEGAARPPRNLSALRRARSASPGVGPTAPWTAGPAGRGEQGAPGPRVPRRLPTPPEWAGHSVVEDGGITHEFVSPVHPLALGDRTGLAAARTCPTDVSVSVFDRPLARRWTRGRPTIQVEGGSFSVAEARRLITAIEDLIVVIVADDGAAGS